MAAGQGFKTFTTGEVLTAGDVNGYLMQGINVFTNATARDAAITAPAEGQFAFTKDNNSLWYYDGAAWVASGATGDIEGVTAGVGISGGGTSGTVTITNSMATAIDAKGDLVAGTGADTFSRLAVGANNTVLTADSTTATGLKWAASTSWAGTYTAYTPVVNQGTTTFGINDGAAYTENGKFVHVIVYFNISSGTGEANRAIEITLPVAAAGDYTSAGACRLNDASASRLYYGENSMSGSTTKFCLVSGANQIDGRWGRTDSQFAIQMASGDEVWASFVYRKA